MTTTIQIDDKIKKRLFQIKLKLEEQKGSAVTYNEIIQFLMDNQSTNIIKKEKLQEFRKLRGILPKSAMTIYLEEKRKELKKEEGRASLSPKDDS
ncbi:MAG: hypothetical protein EU536_00105 [Promethearchaeota archaeon]|nr:MAG: hypothetical protein EU536_00105 [Candidatus Lokiarchaeota archaeon]